MLKSLEAKFEASKNLAEAFADEAAAEREDLEKCNLYHYQSGIAAGYFRAKSAITETIIALEQKLIEAQAKYDTATSIGNMLKAQTNINLLKEIIGGFSE